MHTKGFKYGKEHISSGPGVKMHLNQLVNVMFPKLIAEEDKFEAILSITSEFYHIPIDSTEDSVIGLLERYNDYPNLPLGTLLIQTVANKRPDGYKISKLRHKITDLITTVYIESISPIEIKYAVLAATERGRDYLVDLLLSNCKDHIELETILTALDAAILFYQGRENLSNGQQLNYIKIGFLLFDFLNKQQVANEGTIQEYKEKIASVLEEDRATDFLLHAASRNDFPTAKFTLEKFASKITTDITYDILDTLEVANRDNEIFMFYVKELQDKIEEVALCDILVNKASSNNTEIIQFILTYNINLETRLTALNGAVCMGHLESALIIYETMEKSEGNQKFIIQCAKNLMNPLKNEDKLETVNRIEAILTHNSSLLPEEAKKELEDFVSEANKLTPKTTGSYPAAAAAVEIQNQRREEPEETKEQYRPTRQPQPDKTTGILTR
jgi:hypothetical protein